VTGYVTASGRHCYAFAELPGGCLSAARLTSARPLNPSVEGGSGPFRIYGIAADDVVAVSVRARGVSGRAAMGGNAFYFQMHSPGAHRRFTLTLVAHLRDGTSKQMHIAIGMTATSTRKILPALPGASTPVEDTAA
jgi:hypothetical protein